MVFERAGGDVTRVQVDVNRISASHHKTIQSVQQVGDEEFLLPVKHALLLVQGCGILRNANNNRRHTGRDDDLLKGWLSGAR